MKISVVLLTLDSESTLEECLDGLRFADEVIALDGGSRDRTLEILRARRVTVRPQPAELVAAHRGNFDVARNAGLDVAQHPWTLVVDSDEVVSPELAREIGDVTRHEARLAYSIPRTNLFWNRASRVLGDDRQLRLFPTGEARYEGDYLDARPRVACPTGELRTPLIHRQCDGLGPLLRRLWVRTSQRARVMHEDPGAPREPAFSLGFHTFRHYYRELGASREGWLGAFLSALYAGYPTLTQLKLRWLDRRAG